MDIHTTNTTKFSYNHIICIIFIGLSIVYHWLGLADIFLWSKAILFLIINVMTIICHFIIIIYFFEKELCLFVRNELLFFKSLKNKQN